MGLSIVVLNNQEYFLRFLDPELCTIGETCEKDTVKTISFEYSFQDLKEDKLLFQQGNKIWVSGDNNIEDCLYVINTDVENSIYEGNYFKLELEEVLVELNNAPLFNQLELTTANGFTINNQNNGVEVVLNYNALNYWFGPWFNIGVVQECISTTAGKMTFSGSMTRMNLLRQIEEESGNIFVTRYEKDLNTNTIHRYLDFLNPINCNKDWELNIEYDFKGTEVSGCFDENDNPVDEGTPDAENEDDLVTFPAPDVFADIDPATTKFRIVDENYNPISYNGTLLEWSSEDIGLENSKGSIVIQLISIKGSLALETKTKSFILQGSNSTDSHNPGFISIDDDQEGDVYAILPDDCYFEMVNSNTEKVLFRTCINRQIGHVHNEVLDFGFNIENIVCNVDETDTYSAVSPVLGLNDNTSGSNQLTRGDMETILKAWLKMSVTKGQTIPMIVEKVNVTATSLANAKTNLGTYSLSSNYWVRPLKPQDNTDGTDKTYEFLKATAYWRAPYSKQENEFHVSTDKDTTSTYKHIYSRPDGADLRHPAYDKMGNTSTSDEDIYAIFNQVCMYLKEHETPKVNISVDVANLKDKGEYNNFNLHDKVYIKLPDSNELITARVTKTMKEAHDVAKNSIELDNYSINTVKTLQETVYIEMNNVSFKYPATSSLKARFINADYDSNDEYSVEYPANKLITFSIYKTENNSNEFTGIVYTKLTDINGYCTIPLKLDPGQYEIEAYYPGDEEFTEALMTCKVSVGGTLPVATENSSSSNKSKTTKKTSKKTKTVKTYWTKCGLSPDKKHAKIVSIAKPSSADANKYKYKLYKTVFKNYCPNCRKSGTLRFDGGKKNKCITSKGAHGRGYKINVPEHEVTCIHCDSDYCGVTGLEKSYGHVSRLKTLEKPVSSKNTNFDKLVKGKLQYGTKTVTVKEKNVTSSKARNNVSSGIPKSLKNYALNIVENSKGWAAAKKLAKESGKWTYVGYKNFHRNANTVIKNGGNCCDQARALAELMDASGCLEYITIKYVFVCCNTGKNSGTGHVFLKVTHKETKKWVYVDPCYTKNPWGHHISGWGSPPGTQYNYTYGKAPW